MAEREGWLESGGERKVLWVWPEMEKSPVSLGQALPGDRALPGLLKAFAVISSQRVKLPPLCRQQPLPAFPGTSPALPTVCPSLHPCPCSPSENWRVSLQNCDLQGGSSSRLPLEPARHGAEAAALLDSEGRDGVLLLTHHLCWVLPMSGCDRLPVSYAHTCWADEKSRDGEMQMVEGKEEGGGLEGWRGGQGEGGGGVRHRRGQWHG